jgi:hypothetical protein
MNRWHGLLLAGVLACGAEDEALDGGTHDHSTTGHDSHGHPPHTSTDGGDADGMTEAGSSETGSSGETSEAGSESTGTRVDTWEGWALPEFFVPYCNDCHPGSSPRDFGDYDVVAANEEHIRCGVAPEAIEDCDHHIEPGHLPIGDGPFPSDDERWRLVEWMQAGMPRE